MSFGEWVGWQIIKAIFSFAVAAIVAGFASGVTMFSGWFWLVFAIVFLLLSGFMILYIHVLSDGGSSGGGGDSGGWLSGNFGD